VVLNSYFTLLKKTNVPDGVVNLKDTHVSAVLSGGKCFEPAARYKAILHDGQKILWELDFERSLLCNSLA
jgi:hypothetical protein